MVNVKTCSRCKGTNIRRDYEHGEQYCADCGASYYDNYPEAKPKSGTCPECGGTEIIHDSHAHERICANCGIVL
jgi:transcription initiation factor TFIIIB Brf1 subunit/transcription initiation factor TFIIB